MSDKSLVDGDRLYLIAESLAKDFAMFPTSDRDDRVQGLLSRRQNLRRRSRLANLDIDSYIEEVVTPAEDPGRTAAPEIVRQLGIVIEEKSEGSFYSAIVEMRFDNEPRLIGIIAQDRSFQNGAWMPEHHLLAAAFAGRCSERRMPLVTLMDTPGADAGEAANRANQAHSISRLIAEMSNLDIPNIGIIYGLGYSGGAIPLAASNLILSLRDGVFSTIQPKSLANIARRLNLSWQECAKYVGLSPYELYAQGNIDGVIDFSPNEPDQIDNLRSAVVGAIEQVERRTQEFVAENPYILDHYELNLRRYLHPSEQLKVMQAKASMRLTKRPTEYPNVFGVAFRYLRYLKVRQRIRATTVKQYGRLSNLELPAGELDKRSDFERRQTFLRWLQDPDKVVYEDLLAKNWKSYAEKRDALDGERGRIAQLIFGEPKKNYEDAKTALLGSVSGFLYNRWKNEAVGNFQELRDVLNSPEDARLILRQSDITDPNGLIEVIRADEALFAPVQARFSHDGKKLLQEQGIKGKSDVYVSSQLTAELNLALTGDSLFDAVGKDGGEQAALLHRRGASNISVNRALFQARYPKHIARKAIDSELPELSELTVLDLLISDELREDFQAECESLLLFDTVYDQILGNLDTVAAEAQEKQALSKETLAQLLDRTFEAAARTQAQRLGRSDITPEDAREQLFDWYQRLLRANKNTDFFRQVEEWKKTSFPHLSEALLVVVSYLFEVLLSSYIVSEREGKAFNGRIAPKNIGRRKDFWNRLDMAYRDLQLTNLLVAERQQQPFGWEAFVDRYFDQFEQRFSDLLSSDPCSFPGFRVAIETALEKDVVPCGIVAGMGKFKAEAGGLEAGVLISNVGFQAGSFDMASAEKFCRLLVECAEQHLPVVCFISSGGMQTKEGAGALFSMAAVNDRVTRFVRDHDLPVVIFGFGDCTGGAQASFVTHPLVQTYYFSGTSMPFAGQIVVPSNLPLNSILSNYLSLVPGAMQGLVKHPFFPELDDRLTALDPEAPIPQQTVEEVLQRIADGVLSQERPLVLARQPKYTEADLIRPVRRTLIHARGCTAVKLIRIAQRNNIAVVLVQSDPDMESTAVDMLLPRDTLVCIGGNTPDESYLNALSVLQVAEREGVDSLHPGIGFLSENSQFAELCRNHGINFVGPPVASMETMGNKSNAISTAMKLKVPVVPGSHGILTNAERAAEVAQTIGYPVLIKAVHGGGGKGIQVVNEPSELHGLFYQVTAEARSAFGNGDVYLEKFVTSLRHIEVQLLRDTHGNTRVLGIRDCSVQRDKQKVFEESDSTELPDAQRKAVLDYTAAIADEVGYVGAGTVEFIYDRIGKAVYFMEMNTRLQVEHPVTEWTSGIDIVSEQFRIAAGDSIEHLEPQNNGYSIEARVTAEKLRLGGDGRVTFRPQPGQIRSCFMPEEEGVEVISAAAEGKFVSPYYDSMIAQIIVHAADRNAAIAKLDDYLGRVQITGISTNIPLLRKVLNDSVFIDGVYDTNYLVELFERTDIPELIEEMQQAAGDQDSGISRESILIEDSDELRVVSPATAIFYTTPTPSEPEYVAVGDTVGVDDVLCQLEAMKLFSPLRLKDFNQDTDLYPADQRFEVTRINMANGQQVNAGDLLFVVRPRAAEGGLKKAAGAN